MLPTRGDGMLYTAQLAELLGVGESTIRVWRKRGWLLPDGYDERGRPLHTREGGRAAELRVRDNGLQFSGIDPRKLRKRSNASHDLQQAA